MLDQKEFNERINDLVEEAEEKPVRRVKKEKPNLKESIYSFQPHQLEDWLKENGESLSVQHRFLIGYIINV